ncbi:MAG: MFS transporter [Promethearchaeota archaeon]|nr:MAG: MFS transporter [Candidatus Lokiarchaeota archaeon]
MSNIEQKEGFLYLLKKLWTNFLVYNSHAFTVSMIFINFIIVSNIMWPGEAFHSSELGIMVGTGMYVMAISGLLFGFLADRYSRTYLMSFTEILFGIGVFLNGFVPEGLGMLTFNFFLIYNLIRSFSSGGFYPIIISYVNDSTEEKEKSQFFGMLQALFQLFQIVGMMLSAVLFQNAYWREFFWFTGVIFIGFGILIFLKGKEPKRAATQDELKQVLLNEDIKYEYKLTKETVKSTVLAPTNIIAFVEGIFTTILLMVPDFLFVAYIQSPPHNISSVVSSIYMVIFGLPGGLFGSLALAKLSDKLAKKNIKFRIYFIVFSIVSLFGLYIVLFFLPIPFLTIEQGQNLLFVFSFPILWIMGMCAFFARAVVGIWNINQPPILQAINLPEAQGTISSANQLLELIGSGTGPIVAGFLLIFFNQNYQVTVTITMSIGIIGGVLWLFATKWVNKDIARISNILKERGIELNNKNKVKI